MSYNNGLLAKAVLKNFGGNEEVCIFEFLKWTLDSSLIEISSKELIHENIIGEENKSHRNLMVFTHTIDLATEHITNLLDRAGKKYFVFIGSNFINDESQLSIQKTLH